MASIFKIFQRNAPEKTTSDQKSILDKVNLHRVMAYGDILNDGAIQLSFSLPVEASLEAREAAKRYVEKMGLKEVHVASMESMGKSLSYFVVFGKAKHAVDFTRIVVHKAEFEKMDFDEVHEFARHHFRRKLIVVGATTGADAHTVGLDAIMNMKGYMGDYGLERYSCFRAYNLRSQVSHEDLIKQAVRLKADVILVSKVVTQRNKHLEELKELAKMLKKEKKLKSPLIKIAGGPRLNHTQAAKLGFDAGFGPGTMPSEVAAFIVEKYAKLNPKKH